MIKDLVTPADIKAIYDNMLLSKKHTTNDELVLYNEATRTESQIQIGCHNIIKAKYGHLKEASVCFVQIDNGGKTGINRKKIKKAEGTAKGFPDVVIWLYRKMSKGEYLQDIQAVLPILKRRIFIEFKRIGTFKISPEQQAWHDFYRKWDESAYFCNNSIYFERVICKEIDEFLKERC